MSTAPPDPLPGQADLLRDADGPIGLAPSGGLLRPNDDRFAWATCRGCAACSTLDTLKNQEKLR
jgi:hypothetical protein